MMTLDCSTMDNLREPTDDVETGTSLGLRLWADSDVTVEVDDGVDSVQVVVDYDPVLADRGLPLVTVSLYLASQLDLDDREAFEWSDLTPLDPADLEEDGPELMAAGVRMLADELTACALREQATLRYLDEADEQLRADITATARQMLRTAAELRGNTEVLR